MAAPVAHTQGLPAASPVAALVVFMEAALAAAFMEAQAGRTDPVVKNQLKALAS